MATRQAIFDLYQNPNLLEIEHAPAVLPLRRMFDRNYSQLVSEWGGGYPRQSHNQQYPSVKEKGPFIRMAPDLVVSDLLYERQNNEERKKFMKMKQLPKTDPRRQ